MSKGKNDLYNSFAAKSISSIIGPLCKGNQVRYAKIGRCCPFTKDSLLLLRGVRNK